MSYATTADLADALNVVQVSTDMEIVLQACLDAATIEIDHFLEDCLLVNPLTTEVAALLNRTNVNRAVEWYKAPATYNGGVGMAETGTIKAPTSGFERHWAALIPLRTGSPSGIA
jgi:hypothetical protein